MFHQLTKLPQHARQPALRVVTNRTEPLDGVNTPRRHAVERIKRLQGEGYPNIRETLVSYLGATTHDLDSRGAPVRTHPRGKLLAKGGAVVSEDPFGQYLKFMNEKG